MKSEKDGALAAIAVGLVQCRYGELPRALASYKSLVQYGCDHPALALEIARLLIRAGRPRQSLAYLRVATTDDKSRTMANALAGDIYYKLHQYRKASDHFEIVVQRTPAWIDARRVLAAIYRRLGRERDSAAELRQARSDEVRLEQLARRLAQ